MVKFNRFRNISYLSISAAFLLGSNSVYASTETVPKLNIIRDEFNSAEKLNLSIYNPKLKLTSQGLFNTPMGLYVYTNYPSKIAEYQITIYRQSDVDNQHPIKTLRFNEISPYEALLWQGDTDNGEPLSIDSDYKAILTTTSHDGLKDNVHAVNFSTLGHGIKQESEFISYSKSNVSSSSAANLTFGKLKSDSTIPGFGESRIDHQGIVSGAQDRKVVIQMAGLKDKKDVMLNGERLVVDNSGRAMREMILSPGEYQFDLTWKDEFGQTHSQNEKLVVQKENDIFYVGIVDVTYAQNNVSGEGQSIVEDADSHHYSGKGSWDGRVAFYLKANKEDYRLTAHLDTTETKLKNAFGHLGEKDPTRFVREIDPQAYYPIYGDDSTTESDVDTEGKFYVKLEKGKNYGLWGNYNTQITGNEFANFNRSLYGAKLYHESEQTTKYGDTRTLATIFLSNGETRGSHNELASTGGSLYFLKHQRVTQGSLKLSVEVRDRNTGRVLSTSTLTEGVDYEVNQFQGRIMLTKPLPMTSSGGSGSSIIEGGNLVGGDPVWIIAEYEYYSDGFDLEGQKVFGGRAYHWLNDYLRIGGTYLSEDQASGDNYELKGVDLIVRPTQGTHTQLEYAKTKAKMNDIFVSSNGGLSFTETVLSGDTRGAAWKIEQKIDFNDFTEKDVPLSFKGYYSMQQEGFSSFAKARSSDLEEWGGELRYDFEPDKQGVLVGHSQEKDKANYVERITRAQYYTALGELYKTALELQQRNDHNYGSDSTKETLVAAKLERSFFDGRDKGYIIQQLTLNKSGDVADDNRTTLGYNSQVTESINIGAEVFGSNRGAGGGVQGSWDVNERTSLYTKLLNDVDSTSGRGITTVFGGKTNATSKMELYSERQFKTSKIDHTTSDIYGVNYKPTEAQYVEGSYSIGRVNNRNRNSTSLTGNDETRRDVYAVGYGFKNEKFQMRNRLEYRIDEASERIKQWVTTNRAKTIVSENLSWLTQFDFAKTLGERDDKVVSNYTESMVGFAYRPQAINNLNLFGKLTYVYGLDPDDQLIANSTSSGSKSYTSSLYDQKSWVWSLEGVYEWNANWETAFKAAHRQGHLRYKGESNWYSSGADLYALRVNYKLGDWEYQVEGRTLRTSLADDHKDGLVTSVYRNVGDNIKMGVGYNFTDYNDNLTHLNYRSHGWFVNVVGSF
ncbi:hypothetical protein J3U16_01715 [Gilliamella sp. B3023]|uniref:hypothetical protein n=1 Tax=unclassified Gilliamella TaxID=2685620 RepID=UPI00226AF69D|nr:MULTISPECIES: hypothetical protein [unclassified Gilliamella]MCX8584772.1 hypothetical protein [Gilliamella sp. B3562]MCX8674000.1 hypothetical protein [Gilliamella sp. B3023]MCX8684419.1 hypothetical protein [Gilliamella sp. B2864]